jgi:hypothetical protein
MRITPKDLNVISTLQESPRFLVQKVELKDRLAVLKRAKTKKMMGNLQNEIMSYSVYDSITSGHSDCPFQTASLLASGEDWILLSFLDGETGESLVRRGEKSRVYDRIAEIMAFCDNRVSVTLVGKSLPLPQRHLAEMYEKLEQRRKAFKNIPEEIGLSFSLLETAFDHIPKNAHKLKTCFINPDLSHNHLKVLGNTVSIFDFEINSLFHPRFLDLATQFSNLWFFGDKDEAIKFNRGFWRHRRLEDIEYLGAIKTLLYLKCISFTWQLTTEPSDAHNTEHKLNQDFANNINEVLEYASGL